MKYTLLVLALIAPALSFASGISALEVSGLLDNSKDLSCTIKVTSNSFETREEKPKLSELREYYLFALNKEDKSERKRIGNKVYFTYDYRGLATPMPDTDDAQTASKYSEETYTLSEDGKSIIEISVSIEDRFAFIMRPTIVNHLTVKCSAEQK